MYTIAVEITVGLVLMLWIASLKYKLNDSREEISRLEKRLCDAAGTTASVSDLDKDRVYRVLTTHSYGGYIYYFVTAAPECIPFGVPIIRILGRQTRAPLPDKFRRSEKDIFDVIPV